MRYILYDILIHLCLVLLLPYFIFRMLTRGKYRSGTAERIGLIKEKKLRALSNEDGTRAARVVWFHAVSVGETRAVMPLLKLFKEREPEAKVLFSTVTPTGQEVARTEGRGLIDTLIYLPLDLSWVVRGVVERIKPSAFVVVEKEVWPNIIRSMERRGTPVVVVNGTISKRSFRRYHACAFFFTPLFRTLAFCARTVEDGDRALTLGVRRSRMGVTGNLKLDMEPKLGHDTPQTLRAGFGINPDDRVIVAGSTHAGEERIVLNVFKRLQDEFTGLRLIIAPRHPERFDEVEGVVRDTGLSFSRRSRLKAGALEDTGDVLILDTMGELVGAYAVCDVSFVGGSLADIGGHNLFEPAYFEKPVLFGPHIRSCAHMAEILENAGAGIKVEDEDGLFDGLKKLLSDEALRTRMGMKGKEALIKNRGATEKTLEVIEGALRHGPPAPVPTEDMMRRLQRTFEGWMGSERIGFLPGLVLGTLSRLYGAAVAFRFALYRSGILRKRRLPCKVISIGNITVGGTGKTPMSMFVARKLRHMGLDVVIISRGYKGVLKDVGEVSDGERVKLGPEEAGDEPYLMARTLVADKAGVPVVVGADRIAAGLYAIERFKPDVIVLDDGFQHVRLERDLDIVLVDAKRGFTHARLTPRGTLREPVEGISRAGLLLVKDSNDAADPGFLKGLDMPCSSFSYRPVRLISLTHNAETTLASIKGKRVAALAGIADPTSFLKTLERMGAEVVETLIYPDHHKYSEHDLEEIREISTHADMIVTTEKDAVRLSGLAGSFGPVPAFAVAIEVIVERDDPLESALKALFVDIGDKGPGGIG